MKISSIETVTTTVILILAFVLLSALGVYPPIATVFAIIITLGIYLLTIIAKSYMSARMQKTKIFADLDARIDNLKEYMDKIESRIDEIDRMLEKV
ncbi:MAG: hypothetical protein FIB07_12345 [Candidatus Methanoperedens sp.]|nr:hypothetical protein [Candidatus Methanoperedens sp.]